MDYADKQVVAMRGSYGQVTNPALPGPPVIPVTEQITTLIQMSGRLREVCTSIADKVSGPIPETGNVRGGDIQPSVQSMLGMLYGLLNDAINAAERANGNL